MKFTFSPESTPLGGYTIKRAIHRGGFGEVYYALSDSGKEVALKLLQQNLEIELRGVRQCMNLKHPNLVTIFDIREDNDGDQWVIMEYLHGKTMDKVIHEANGPLPMRDVEKWLSGIVAGLSFLHDRGIVHRDLKPANIFRENEIVKIGDVGLAKFITHSRRSAQTESVGTVYYMAPEVGHGRYGHEVDVYSLGIILYEILTGRLPFDGESTAEILMKHLTEKPDLSVLPRRLRPVLANVLEKDPARRTPSAQQLLSEFRDAIAGIEIATTVPNELFSNSSLPNNGRSNNGQKIDATVVPVADVKKTSPVNVPVTSTSSPPSDPNSKWTSKTPEQRADSIITGAKILGSVFFSCCVAVGLASLWSVTLFMHGLIQCAAYFGLGHIGNRFINWMVQPFKRFTSKKRVAAAPVFDKPVPKRRRGQSARHRRLHATALCPEIVRDIPWRYRLTELTGSMVLSAVSCIILSASVFLITGFGDRSISEFVFFNAVAILGCWSLLTSAKCFEGEEKTRKRRLFPLFMGFAVGAIAFYLQHELLIQDGHFYRRWNHHQSFSFYLQHGVLKSLGCSMLFFGGLFFLRRWWRHTDSLRDFRFSVWTVLFTTFLGFIVGALLRVPTEWATLWAAIISCCVQLSSPWMSPDDRKKLAEGTSHE